MIVVEDLNTAFVYGENFGEEHRRDRLVENERYQGSQIQRFTLEGPNAPHILKENKWSQKKLLFKWVITLATTKMGQWINMVVVVDQVAMPARLLGLDRPIQLGRLVRFGPGRIQVKWVIPKLLIFHVLWTAGPFGDQIGFMG